MSTHKHFDKLCCVVLAITLVLTIVVVNMESLGVQKASTVMGYENKLFDTSKVHTINIIMDDWDEFLANCQSEEYYTCTVVIDNDAYKNIGIRGKGNTSLTQVASYGNDRYSFKLEFDHYDSTTTYYGLDKLCLNNIIQDNTYMKDYLCYQMMAEMGVAAPLCSYVYITVNGEDWGLYLAVEAVEESFLQRNYGSNYGELYKPDSQSMGGGRGNGEKFDLDEFFNDRNLEDFNTEDFNMDNFNMDDFALDGMIQEAAGETNHLLVSQNQSGTTQNPNGQMPDGQMQNPNGQMPDGQMQNPNGQMPDGNMQNPNGQMPDGQMQNPNGQMPDGQMQNPNSENMDEQTTEESGSGNQMPNGITPPQMNGENGFAAMLNGSDDVLLKYIDDNFESYSNIFDNAKTDVSDSDKERLIEALKNLSAVEDLENTVDIEAVIRYFVVHNFVLNFDSYTGSMIHNYYLYEKDGQMQMIPWDYNLSFGGFDSAGGAESLINYPIDSPVSGGNAQDRPMLAWIFANEEYTELYHQYFAEFIASYFDSGYFTEMMDTVFAMIAPYVEKDPTKFCTYEEFETGITTLKEFCLLRAESINAQLNGTIGSTSETQESSSLIDAGDIQISDMGSMNQSMGGGGGMPNFGGNMQKPDFSDTNTEASDGQPTIPNMGNADGQPPQMPNENGNGSSFDAPNPMPGNDNGNNADMPNPMQGNENNNNSDMLNPMQGSDNHSDAQNFDMGNHKNPNMEFPDGQEQSSVSIETWILFGVSAGILILGVGFACIFRRRR